MIGQSSVSGSSGWWEGSEDEVRVSNIARSAQWISTEYNNQNSPASFYSLGIEEARTLPGAPVVSNEIPHDGATGITLNPTLSITVHDYQGDTMEIAFWTNDTGSWQQIGTTQTGGNGTYTQATTMFNTYDTLFSWKIEVTDPSGSGTTTRETYQFRTQVEPGSWMDTDWQYRKSHIINGATGAGTNHQVKVVVHAGSGADDGENIYLGNKGSAGFGDIRFTDNDGVTPLDYWIESTSGGSINKVHGILYVDNFVKYPGNPIMNGYDQTFSLAGIREPVIMMNDSGFAAMEGGNYVMYYNGWNDTASTWQIGRATSPDGITWTKDTGNPVFTDSTTPYGSAIASVIKRRERLHHVLRL